MIDGFDCVPLGSSTVWKQSYLYDTCTDPNTATLFFWIRYERCVSNALPSTDSVRRIRRGRRRRIRRTSVVPLHGTVVVNNYPVILSPFTVSDSVPVS